MLLKKDIQITVFRVDNEAFEPLGDISQYTSLIWPDAFVGYSEFELWAPITSDNAELLKYGNVIWTGGENAAVIEVIKSTVNEDGGKEFDIKGRTLEKFLADRIIVGTYSAKKIFTSTIMYDIVNKNCINPSDPNRKIRWLENSVDDKIGKNITQYQKTGGEIYDTFINLVTESDIGFNVLFDPRNKKMIFEVRAGVDRTYDNSDGNDPVVFDTDLEDILSSRYYYNSQDEKTVALVKGEGEGIERKEVYVGDKSGKGFDRKELYVDARDLQSEVYNGDETTTLSDIEYMSLLTQRGEEKLAEHDVTETFESQIRQYGEIQYVFGKDYTKGDKVTVIDKQLGIMVSARITEVEEDFGEEYSLHLVFGYSYPTMLTKVKRMITL